MYNGRNRNYIRLDLSYNILLLKNIPLNIIKQKERKKKAIVISVRIRNKRGKILTVDDFNSINLVLVNTIKINIQYLINIASLLHYYY